MEFHWWYIPVAMVLFFIFFGKGKGGMVSKEFKADLEFLGEGDFFERAEARRVFFKNGQDEKFSVDINNSPFPEGSSPEIYINGTLLTSSRLERDGDLDFDIWKSEAKNFPEINPGDIVEVKHGGQVFFKGTFQVA